jgi:hypothetical protein
LACQAGVLVHAARLERSVLVHAGRLQIRTLVHARRLQRPRLVRLPVLCCAIECVQVALPHRAGTGAALISHERRPHHRVLVGAERAGQCVLRPELRLLLAVELVNLSQLRRQSLIDIRVHIPGHIAHRHHLRAYVLRAYVPRADLRHRNLAWLVARRARHRLRRAPHRVLP